MLNFLGVIVKFEKSLQPAHFSALRLILLVGLGHGFLFTLARHHGINQIVDLRSWFKPRILEKNMKWFSRGDWNAFFGLAIDNLAVMISLFSLLTFAGIPNGYTPEFVLTRMLPGTALGVLAGDLAFTLMAYFLAKKLNSNTVTAMPLGLDTPSTFGMAFLVLLPALAKGNELFPQNHDQAMTFGWNVGLGVLILIGLIKIVFSPFGNLVRQWVPRAGLLGSLAAIALTLISFMPLREDIAGMPVVGLPCLLVILVCLLAHRVLPFKFPGTLFSVLLGLFLYAVSIFAGRIFDVTIVDAIKPFEFVGHFGFQIPWAFSAGDGSWWETVFREVLFRMPMIFPFALATIVGGIDCTESAASAGDEYDTRSVLFVEAFSSLIAGFAGGVIQTTPYIGQPAYKKMGALSGYTLLTALFIGLAGFMGGLTVLFHLLPKVVLFPILVFVGIEITSQTFRVVNPRHYPALTLAILPSLAYLGLLLLKSIYAPLLPERPDAINAIQTLRCLANGFLISGMLWAALMVSILDDKLAKACCYCLVAALLSFFGVIHSPLADEAIGFPWVILGSIEKPFVDVVKVQTPYHWAGGYLICAAILLILSRWGKQTEELVGEDGEFESNHSGKI